MAAKTTEEWLSAYGESHQHPFNKALHWVCVPTIAACVLALLWDVPKPSWFGGPRWWNWASLTTLACLAFYVRLSPALAAGMLVCSTAVLAALAAYDAYGPTPVWQAGLAAFVAAWIGQFAGHAVEGRRPSFFQDLQFLLIGPIWLLAAAYRKLGIPYA